MSPENQELINAARTLFEENRKAYAAQRIADLNETDASQPDTLRAAIAGNVLIALLPRASTVSATQIAIEAAVQITDLLLIELKKPQHAETVASEK